MKFHLVSFSLALMVSGCVHPATTAERYQAEGQYSLALEYQSLAYELDDRSTAEPLLRAVELARAGFKEGLQSLETLGQFEKGHALVVEWLELERWIARQRIPGLNEPDFGDLSKEWRLKARRSLLEQVDASVSSGLDLHERLRLLRHALALSPSDRELKVRYERLKAALSRQVMVEVRCDPLLRVVCEEVRGIWLEAFSEVRRELIHNLEKSASQYDTKLFLTVSGNYQHEDWYVRSRDSHELEVPRYNEFREPMTNADGEELTEIIRAESKVEEAWQRVSVSAELVWKDLRDKAKPARTFKSNSTQESKAQYLSWKGDSRALEQSGLMNRIATSRRNPLSPRLLERRGVDAAVTKLFSAWIKEVEK